MQLNIIALTGSMGAGKSTALSILKRQLKQSNPELKVVLVKFAQPLYDMQRYIYKRIGTQVKNKKDRFLLQWLGSEWGRQTQHSDLWLNLWKTKVEELATKHKNLLIVTDDVRFDNEATVVKALGGHVVRITCDHTSGRIDTSKSNHISEQGVSSLLVDLIIENNKTKSDLKNQLTNVIKFIKV